MSRFTVVGLAGDVTEYSEMSSGDALVITDSHGGPLFTIEDLGKKRFHLTIHAPFMTVDEGMLTWLSSRLEQHNRSDVAHKRFRSL